MKSINPYNNKTIQEYKQHSYTDINESIDLMQEEFSRWKETDFSERADLLKNAAKILEERKQELAELISLEMGKIIGESIAEVEKCAWVCRYYAENGEKFLTDEIIETDAGKSFVAFEPLGIVLAVMPWNFPFWQVFRFAAPALMAGNAGLLKHASNVPGCAMAIEEVFRQAGFPEHIFKALLIHSSYVAHIIENKHVKAITLTGSEAAGSAVAECAGKNLKKTVLELGGSDPFIVLDDADLELAAKTAVTARMINMGQSCIAAKRFIVSESVQDVFIEKIKEILDHLKPGDPLDPNTNLAPLARMEFVNDLENQVERSVEMGARLITGGKSPDVEGCFYEPGILSNVSREMPAFREEIFGPVFPVITAQDEEEAIKLANDSNYGLGGSVWTKDIERGERIARRIETGAVFVNGLTKSDPRLPFGGIKNSGYGRELSHYGIKEFVNIKTIWISS